MGCKPSDVVTVNGVTLKLTEFAAQLGTPVQTIISRLKRGWSIDRACTEALVAPNPNKGKKADADVLDPDELQRLLDAGNKGETSIRDRVFLVLAYRTGLRCSEIRALKPKDADINRGTVSVHHGKGDKARVVALDPQGWAHLSEWIQLRESWGVGDKSPLFCTREGKQLGDRQIRSMVQRRAKKAGISKHVHAHGLRRTMASEMAAEGVPLIDIATIMGHSNVATTDTYLKKINPTSALEAMKRRSWGPQPQLAASRSSTVPQPGWLEWLKGQIGDRLVLMHDGRSSETEFKAAVLLF